MSRLNSVSTYEFKKIYPLRKPLITCPSVPLVPQSLLDTYSEMPRLLLEEYFGSLWYEDDENRRSWCIAQFDLLKDMRLALRNLALIIKYFKRPIEKYLSEDETQKIFLTVEALFWYHLDFYQALVANSAVKSEKIISADLCHFIEASSLDHAIIFTEYPANIDIFEALMNSRPTLRPHYEVCQTRLQLATSSDINFAGLVGFLYRRFQDIKSQVGILVGFGPESEETGSLKRCKFLLDAFENACGKILESRVDMITLFNAFSKAGNSEDSAVPDKKIFGPLDVSMDRRANLKDTIKQMQLNARVRYNQAIFAVEYCPAKPGKPSKYTVTSKQVSLSIFSRHLALLEIVFPKKKLFRKQKQDSWTYRLLQPLLPLDQVTLHKVPESETSQFLVEIRILNNPEFSQPMYFKCEDAKHKQDLFQQFRLIALEACPSTSISYQWRYQSEARITSSDEEMILREERYHFGAFSTSSCGSGSVAKRPDGLIKLTKASNRRSHGIDEYTRQENVTSASNRGGICTL